MGEEFEKQSEGYSSSTPRTTTAFAPNGRYALATSSHTLPNVVVTGKDKSRIGAVKWKAARTQQLTAADAAKAQDAALTPALSWLFPNLFRGIDSAQKGDIDGVALEALKAAGLKGIGTLVSNTTKQGLNSAVQAVKTAVSNPTATANAAKAAATTAAKNVATPGSTFWTNPLTRRFATGLGAHAGLTGLIRGVSDYDSFSDLAGSAVEETTGWNPNSTVTGQFITESLDPTWYANPDKVSKIVKVGGDALLKPIKGIRNIDDAMPVIKNVFKTSDNPFNWRNYRFLGDRRFYSDLERISPYGILRERRDGNYPLTFAERRKYVTDFKNDVYSGIDYAKLEATANLKAPLKDEGWVLDPVDRIWRYKGLPVIQDIEMTPHFGTLKATKVYGKTPREGNYNAFEDKGEVYFPFRNEPNTLRGHTNLDSSSPRRGVGAHEFRHVILEWFKTPLIVLNSRGYGSYNRYTNKNLPQDFRTNLRLFIKDNGTAGEWEGSLAEMDSELTGWGARFGFPSKYSEMTPQQKALVYDLFQRRFGKNSDYSLYNDVQGILNSSKIEPLSTFELNIDNSRIGKILQGLETLGYRKQGGKIWEKNLENNLKKKQNS